MGLIDAEKLCEYARSQVSRSVDANDIMRFPTVDAEPVRHGHWVKSSEYRGDDTSSYIDNHWKCSECGKEAIVNEWYMYDLTDYCPHCGAKMNEVEE